ncbi:MAG: hypothetical protein M0P31_12380 [Solirubrobacteraceae bacterium]|nr:hypothetical protein [Solirubrobacteraceae bacterium]
MAAALGAAGLAAPTTSLAPVEVWVAVEASNAVVPGDPTSNVQVQKLTTTVQIDTNDDVNPPVIGDLQLAATTWRATGGPIRLRQAVGGSLPQLPVGRNGNLRSVNGSVYVHVDMSSTASGFFALDCQPGNVVDHSGTIHSEALGKSLVGAGEADPFRVPGFVGRTAPAGYVGAGDDASVDAQILHRARPGTTEWGYVRPDGQPNGGPEPTSGWVSGSGDYNAGVLPVPRRSGEALTLHHTAGNELRVRLTPDQVDAWLGPDAGDTVDVSARVQVSATGLAPAEREVTSAVEDWDSTDGELPTFALPGAGWTATSDTGALTLRPGTLAGADGASIVLTADTDGGPRTLELVRGRLVGSTIEAPAGNPPFLRVPPPPVYEPYVPPPTGGGGGDGCGDTPPPIIGDGGGGGDAGFRPPPPGPIVTPPADDAPKAKAAKKRTTVRITKSSLRRRSGRIPVTLRNLDRKATTRARVEVRTRGRYRIGKRKARITRRR